MNYPMTQNSKEKTSQASRLTLKSPICEAESGVASPTLAKPIHVHTLGRFGVSLNGQPSSSPGKAQQRPLALLKALIARGGLDVPGSQLWECLWPDSDGDLGARNLTITLHRLRHLLGTNASVQQTDCKLSLNPRLCWVDVWAFDRLANGALNPSELQTGTKSWEIQLRSALCLYAGHFLALEAEEAWMLEPRIRWKARFERIVAALSSHLQYNGRFDEAIDLCLHALEVDPLNEVNYRRLMACYLELGETAAVARVYASCRDVLVKSFASQPSFETDRIHRLALERSQVSRHRASLQLMRAAGPLS